MDKKMFIEAIKAIALTKGVEVAYDEEADRITAAEFKEIGGHSVAHTIDLARFGEVYTEAIASGAAEQLVKAVKDGIPEGIPSKAELEAAFDKWEEKVLLRVADPKANKKFACKTPIKSLVGGLFAYAFIPLNDEMSIEVLPQNAESKGFKAPVSSHSLFAVAAANTEKASEKASLFGAPFVRTKSTFASGVIACKEFLKGVASTFGENSFALLPFGQDAGYCIMPKEVAFQDIEERCLKETVRETVPLDEVVGQHYIIYDDGVLSDVEGNIFDFA
jgi:hypothetical protein